MTSNTAISTHHFKSGLFSNLVHGLLGVEPQSHSFASHTTSSTYQSVRHTQYGRYTFRLLPRNEIQSRNNKIPYNFCTELIAESLQNAMISQSGNYNPFSALPPLSTPTSHTKRYFLTHRESHHWLGRQFSGRSVRTYIPSPHSPDLPLILYPFPMVYTLIIIYLPTLNIPRLQIAHHNFRWRFKACAIYSLRP